MKLNTLPAGSMDAVYQNTTNQGKTETSGASAGQPEGIPAGMTGGVWFGAAGDRNVRGKDEVPGIYTDQAEYAAGADDKEIVQDSGEEEKTPEELAESVTKEDYLDIAAEGYTLEGFNLERLARAIERIKEGRALRDASVEAQQKKQQENRENVKKAAQGMVQGNPVVQYIAELLSSADIPVTDTKLKEFSEAAQLGIEGIYSGITDAAKAYLIGNRQQPSIDNLYRAAHSGTAGTQALSEDVWQQLQSSAQSILKETGIAADAKGMSDARWLIEHNLPMTAENLLYKSELDELSEKKDISEMLDKIIAQMKQGKNAEKTNLADAPWELKETKAVQEARKVLENILPETVDEAAARWKSGIQGEDGWSLDFLQKLQQELAAGGSGTKLQDITARRQLEEVRLRLTLDAGRKLIRQGIRLDTDGLGKIVQGLRELENEYYGKLFQETTGQRAEADEISLLRQTDEALADLKTAPMQLLGVTFATRSVETLHTLHESGSRLTMQAERAQERYEALMTKPRSDMGDTVKEAFRSVDPLLSEMGMEATDENRRAVRMLTYNHVELTEENLYEMKLYDAKVQQVFRDMNPAACARMIQRGINPLDMPVDELSQTLRTIREQEGASTEEKYSSYLVKLDQHKELSSEEREAYIGIYRLLHQVAKSDGAAVGALAASGRELTLSNLLSAVRTARRGSVDTRVDDRFGGLEELNVRGKSISEQINGAFLYPRQLAEELADTLTPERIYQAGGADEVMEMELEQLADRMRQANLTDESGQYAQAKVDDLVQMVAESEPEQAFLRACGQEVTPAGIRAAKGLTSAQSVYGRLKELAARYDISAETPAFDAEKITNREKMKEMVEKWNQSADNTIEQLFEHTKLTGQDSVSLLSMRGMIRLAGALSEREYYEIPLRSESGFVKLNLTVQHSGGAKGSARIAFRGEERNMSFELSMENRKLNCYVSMDSRDELEQMKQIESNVIESLKEQGFEVTQWNYGLMTRLSGSALNGFPAQDVQEHAEAEATRTDDLYLAAKIIVKAVQSR